MLRKFLKTTKNKLQMLNSNTKDAEDLRIYQIIDANLDRAREGLRVLEDWARFGLGKEKYVEKINNFRQFLGKNHLEVYKQSRNNIEDKCKGLTHQEQFNRKTSEQIISSNSGRVQEALRVKEEFSRQHNHELSKIASEIRYEIYTLEIDLLSLSRFKKSEKILKENDLYVITDQKENLLEIIEQIVPIFQPSYQMTLKLVDDMQDFRDVPIILNSINYSDDYEGSFDEKKITLITMSFTVKAYIFGPVGTQAPIKKAKADIYTDMKDVATTRQVAYQVQPKALTDKDQDGTTELTQAINSRNLTIEVLDYTNIPTQSYIEIGNEVLYVKSKTSPNKLSVRRAQNGTKAAAATAGTPIDLIDVNDDNLLTGGDDFGFSETVSYYE